MSTNFSKNPKYEILPKKMSGGSDPDLCMQMDGQAGRQRQTDRRDEGNAYECTLKGYIFISRKTLISFVHKLICQ
jgi:hypothetical protein